MASVPRSVWRNPIHFFAFGFGSGAIPVAPGTFGTLMAALIYLPMQNLNWSIYLIVVLASFFAGIWLCGRTATDIGVHDHGGIVWDEFVGYWITMFMAPEGLWWIVLGFALFRLFDIVKPWPIRWLDKNVSGGFGVMIDDVLAGLMACACLQTLAMILL
jgi:phosphatidylglycerophosphatase A